MAKILMAAGIEIVSGAVTRIDTKGNHVFDGNMFLFTHRKAETTNKVCQRAYYRKINSLPWQKSLSVDIEAQRVRTAFGNGATAVNTRRGNLTLVAADQAQYHAIEDEVRSAGYRITMRSFLWAAYKQMGAESFASGAITMTATQYKQYCSNAARPNANVF